MRYAISISTYDKYDELGVILDIVRENWSDNYYISVCSNHPNADEKIKKYKDKIDKFETGDDIRYNPSSENTSTNLKYRIHNSILTACRGALTGTNISHILHVHADAWQLSERSLKTLINEMKENDASAAFKIETPKFVRKYPPGHMIDQLWVIDAKDAKSTGFFDCKALDFPTSESSHYIWPMLCLVHFGMGKVYQYSNRSEEVLWNGTEAQGNIARPMFYNPKRGQVHIASEDFKGDLGKSLQVYYLLKHGLVEGKNIQKYIEKYRIGEEELFNRLEKWMSNLNEKLNWYGLSVDDFDHNIQDINSFLDKTSSMEKWKYVFVERLGGTTLWKILKGIYSLLKTKTKDPSPDVEKSQMLENYYQTVLQREDFPQKSLGKTTIIPKGN